MPYPYIRIVVSRNANFVNAAWYNIGLFALNLSNYFCCFRNIIGRKPKSAPCIPVLDDWVGEEGTLVRNLDVKLETAMADKSPLNLLTA